MQKRTLLKGLHWYAVGSGVAALVIIQMSSINDFNAIELTWSIGATSGLIAWNAWRLYKL
ncbi:hypothetical protein N836_09455 [Leptolyngbya sp. Heron Island J]|uniref:hypothetical protein n=1 Tax=Leptolyngbya sp. Heron Island J TaxID=1385935 RepID=UPI0003B9D198|nr:hypothetical protein [Leptolyngbya sp. Heron Island J]ESA35935.1 hypothetical protein N836_09455 [Leptolyngbya sp. Heron Island J]